MQHFKCEVGVPTWVWIPGAPIGVLVYWWIPVEYILIRIPTNLDHYCRCCRAGQRHPVLGGGAAVVEGGFRDC